ncbi:hypothetical protein EDD16DRAFT_1659055, partial [Pisolithus croceorrhizus]
MARDGLVRGGRHGHGGRTVPSWMLRGLSVYMRYGYGKLVSNLGASTYQGFLVITLLSDGTMSSHNRFILTRTFFLSLCCLGFPPRSIVFFFFSVSMVVLVNSFKTCMCRLLITDREDIVGSNVISAAKQSNVRGIV